jgi:hypothetical protein
LLVSGQEVEEPLGCAGRATDVEELEAIEFRYVGNPSADLSFLKYVCSEGRYIIVWSCPIDLL